MAHVEPAVTCPCHCFFLAVRQVGPSHPSPAQPSPASAQDVRQIGAPCAAAASPPPSSAPPPGESKQRAKAHKVSINKRNATPVAQASSRQCFEAWANIMCCLTGSGVARRRARLQQNGSSAAYIWRRHLTSAARCRLDNLPCAPPSASHPHQTGTGRAWSWLQRSGNPASWRQGGRKGGTAGKAAAALCRAGCLPGHSLRDLFHRCSSSHNPSWCAQSPSAAITESCKRHSAKEVGVLHRSGAHNAPPSPVQMHGGRMSATQAPQKSATQASHCGPAGPSNAHSHTEHANRASAGRLKIHLVWLVSPCQQVTNMYHVVCRNHGMCISQTTTTDHWMRLHERCQITLHEQKQLSICS